MEKSESTVQNKVQMAVGLYGSVITDNGKKCITADMKLIPDLFMFGKCIMCQLWEKSVWHRWLLEEISGELKDYYVVLDNRVRQYRLEEIIPEETAGNICLLFLRIAGVAFLRAQKDIDILRALVDVYAIGPMDDIPDSTEIAKIKAALGNDYRARFQTMEKLFFAENLCEQKEFKLLHEHLETEIKNLESMTRDFLCRPEVLYGKKKTTEKQEDKNDSR